jgi:hypothetical protein
MNILFRRVVATSRISSLFAEHAVTRACERAGVNPQKLSPATLRIALPEIEKTILTFCHQEAIEILPQLYLLSRA